MVVHFITCIFPVIRIQIKQRRAVQTLLNGAEMTPIKKPPSGKRRIPSKVREYKKSGNWFQALKDFNMVKPTSVAKMNTNADNVSRVCSCFCDLIYF